MVSRPRAKRKALNTMIRLAAGLVAAGALVGCSTPGPAHAYLYSRSPGEASTLRDVDPRDGAELALVPAFVDNAEQVIGIAYDPFTDHLFLRIFPGNLVRVIDRPAGKLKREFTAVNQPLGGEDLAIRSSDRHLFFTDPTGPALIETDLYGKLENHIPLDGLAAPVHGIAHDAVKDEFIVLPEARSTRLLRFSTEGRFVSELPLEEPVQGYSLGYDAADRTYFASLADGSAIGVFDHAGRLLRSLPRPLAEWRVFIDVGPRSLLRMF